MDAYTTIDLVSMDTCVTEERGEAEITTRIST
jgi:hypothetical protein